jgi:hypothetical protein
LFSSGPSLDYPGRLTVAIRGRKNNQVVSVVQCAGSVSMFRQRVVQGHVCFDFFRPKAATRIESFRDLAVSLSAVALALQSTDRNACEIDGVQNGAK